MPKKIINNNLPRARQSRFLVDLVSIKKDESEPAVEVRKNGRLFSEKKEVDKNTTSVFSIQEIRKSRISLKEKLGRLFVFSFIKYFIKITSKIGFLAVFIISFNLLFLIRLLKLFKYPIFFANRIISIFEKKKTVFSHKSTQKEKQEGERELLSKEKRNRTSFFEIIKRFQFRNLIPNFQYKTLKSALISFLVFIVVILPVKGFAFYLDLQDTKGRVIGASEEAISQIYSAGTSAKKLNFLEAESDFTKASLEFSKAKEEIGNLSIFLSIISRVLPTVQARAAGQVSYILDAGHLSAQIGAEFSEALKVFSSEEKTLKNIIEVFSVHFGKSEILAIQLQEIINKIDVNALPEEHRQKFLDLKEKSGPLVENLKEINDILEKAKIFLGFDYGKRYLVVFQNNTEIRASGGFIGSYALVDFLDGSLKKVEVPPGGSYDTEGGMRSRIIAPAPLRLVNPLWHFWDSNWWPDWPTSAKKIANFLEKSSGPSVDGVISLTPTVVEKLLSVIGPVSLTEENNISINSENFWQVVQTFSEQKPINHPEYQDNPYLSKETNEQIKKEEILLASTTKKSITNVKPKRIVGELLSEIIKVLPQRMNKQMFIDLLKITEDSFLEKQILLYFSNEDLEKKADDYDWSGKVKQSKYDYLQIVHTNIGGGKSDKVINENESLVTEIRPDGTIENTLTINRTHNGLKNERFSGGRNVDWLRVYVPLGAKLIFSEGFERPEEKYFSAIPEDAVVDPAIEKSEKSEITEPGTGTITYEDLDKTVFANWLMVDPGKSVVITLKYVLPFSLKLDENALKDKKLSPIGILNTEPIKMLPFSLLWQKQPGSVGISLKQTLLVDNRYKTIYEHKQEIDCTTQCPLDRDKYWAWLFRE